MSENSIRKILAVTGIRSEYDIMSSVYAAIARNPILNLKLIVTGAHLSPSYGNTINEIRDDGFEVVDEIESLLNSDSSSSRVKGLGIQLQSMVQTVLRESPHVLMVLGDREEAMTTALLGAYMNIPVAHLCGGDRAIGNVDDQVRHAVTKLSHIHFVTNEESKERILKLGEEDFRVFNVGNPGLDRLLSCPVLSHESLSNKIGFNFLPNDPLIVLIQHVISTESGFAYDQMKSSLEAIKDLKIKTVIIYPNSDSGGQEIIRAIREYENLPFVKVAKNLPRLEFVNLLRHASCLLGNSSAGILEAPLLKLPVINVGNRQRGRLHSSNVEFVSHNKNEIIEAVKKAIFDQKYRKKVSECANPYGNGDASEKIASILASLDLNKFLLKDITY